MNLLHATAHRWLLGVLLLVTQQPWVASYAAEEPQDSIVSDGIQVICAPDMAVAHIDESITVRAWAVEASGKRVPTVLAWVWSTTIGTVKEDVSDVAVWSFSWKDTPAGSSTISTITATAISDAGSKATCDITITLAWPSDTGVGGVRDLHVVNRLSGRTFLIPNEHEPKGYGLYTHLLLDSPPTNSVGRARYLGVIASYLQLIQPNAEMERYRHRSQLNLIIVPVKQPVVLPDNLSDPKQAAEAAEQVLEVYDYARAQSLLATLGPSGVRSGPYLISTIRSESSEKRVLLYFDMSRVDPSLVTDWFRTFTALATQESSWSEITLNKFALNTRNVLAVMARDTPEVVSELAGWIKVLKRR